MKKLYFLVFLVMSFATQAQIVNIPDANFKAKLLSASPSNFVAKNLTGDYFKIDANNDGEIQESEAFQVSTLSIDCEFCDNSEKISNLLGIEYFTSLTFMWATYNNLINVDVHNLIFLEILDLRYNNILSVNIQNLINLSILSLDSNQLTSIDTSTLISLNWLDIANNQLSSLDLSSNYNLDALFATNNLLNSINIKNGSTNFDGLLVHFEISNNPNLQYICVNESNFDYFGINNFKQEYSNFYFGNPNYLDNVEINSYCTTTPSPLFNQLILNSKFDIYQDGCDINDSEFDNLKYKLQNNNFITYLYPYNNLPTLINLPNGNYTVTPILNNPNLFVSNPISSTVSFPSSTTSANLDFCITQINNNPNIEIIFLPLYKSIPGVISEFKIIILNKGSSLLSGSLNVDFEGDKMNFINPGIGQSPNSQTNNSIQWNYTNLVPGHNYNYYASFDLNGPMDNPSLSLGDQINFSANVISNQGDVDLSDNTHNVSRILVSSYDPNDKTCIEGMIVGPEMIGQYVHYLIRFENSGTYFAENIVIKDMIDTNRFDIDSMQPIDASHNFRTVVKENRVEFFFDGINLPFDDANNDGYIAFKIKTKQNLAVGDTFSNNASIYFDYNFPIITNTYTTTIAALNTTDFDFGAHFTLYPNPVKEVLNIQSKDNTTINSIEIYNTLGQLVLAIPNAISTVDVSSLQLGNYFVKVNTDLGVSNTKFIKE